MEPVQDKVIQVEPALKQPLDTIGNPVQRQNEQTESPPHPAPSTATPHTTRFDERDGNRDGLTNEEKEFPEHSNDRNVDGKEKEDDDLAKHGKQQSCDLEIVDDSAEICDSTRNHGTCNNAVNTNHDQIINQNGNLRPPKAAAIPIDQRSSVAIASDNASELQSFQPPINGLMSQSEPPIPSQNVFESSSNVISDPQPHVVRSDGIDSVSAISFPGDPLDRQSAESSNASQRHSPSSPSHSQKTDPMDNADGDSVIALSECAPSIPYEAKKFEFASQVMIVGLSNKSELNHQLGFVVGEFKRFSERIPIRLMSGTSGAPVYLLKVKNLRFISPPIPGFVVDRYASESSDTEKDSDADDENEDGNGMDGNGNESDCSAAWSTDEEHSRLPFKSVSSVETMSLKENEQDEFESVTIASTSMDAVDDHDLGLNELEEKERLKEVDKNMKKYRQIVDDMNRSKVDDCAMSVASNWSTKSLPVNLGLRWEPRPVVESIKDLKIEKIGSIYRVIDECQVVIESVHDPKSYISFGSVICMEDKTPIGRVDDIFGSIKKPLYFIRLPIDKAIELKDRLIVDQHVFAVTVLSAFMDPPQCEQRFSSESEYSDSEDEGTANSKTKSTTTTKRSLRNRRASSVDRQGSALPNGRGRYQRRPYTPNRGGYRRRGGVGNNNNYNGYRHNPPRMNNGYRNMQNGFGRGNNNNHYNGYRHNPPRMNNGYQNLNAMNMQSAISMTTPMNMNMTAYGNSAGFGGMGIPSAMSNLASQAFNPLLVQQQLNQYQTQMQQQRLLTQSQFSVTPQAQTSTANATNTQAAPSTNGASRVRSNPFSFRKK